MAETGDWGGDPADIARRFDEGFAAAADRDAFIRPRGPERFPWERLSRLPREITGFRILGKSVGDLAKEAAVSGSLGALFRIGLGTTGAGGIGLAVAVGGGVSGIREHFKRTNETWLKLRTEQGGVARLGVKDTLKGFLNPDQKRSIAGAVARGATFGAVGGLAGGLISETGFGEAVKGAFGKVGEATGTVGRWRESWFLPSISLGPAEAPALLETQTPTPTAEPTPTRIPTQTAAVEPTPTRTVVPSPTETPSPTPTPQPAGVPTVEAQPSPTPSPATPTPTETPIPPPVEVPPPTSAPAVAEKLTVEPSKYINNNQPWEVEIKPDTKDWIRDVNNLHGEYGTAIQAEVGKYVPWGDPEPYLDKIIEQTMQNQGQSIKDLDPVMLETVRNHLLHVMEDQANKAFDSQLQEAVANNMDLDQVKEMGHQAFSEWVNNEAGTKLAEQVNLVIQVHEGIAEAFKPGPDVFGRNLSVSLFNTGKDLSDFISGPRIISPRELGIDILANYDFLTENWKVAYPDTPFPAYLGEIYYLITEAEKGDQLALERLRKAFGVKAFKDGFLYFPQGGFSNRLLNLLMKLS